MEKDVICGMQVDPKKAAVRGRTREIPESLI